MYYIVRDCATGDRSGQDLDELIDDLLFEIAGEAQMSGCYSGTEARMEGSDRQW